MTALTSKKKQFYTNQGSFMKLQTDFKKSQSATLPFNKMKDSLNIWLKLRMSTF